MVKNIALSYLERISLPEIVTLLDILLGNRIGGIVTRMAIQFGSSIEDKIWKDSLDYYELFNNRRQKVEICRSYKFLMIKPLLVQMFERLAIHALPKAEIAI
jgi:hypothetical protein